MKNLVAWVQQSYVGAREKNPNFQIRSFFEIWPIDSFFRAWKALRLATLKDMLVDNKTLLCIMSRKAASNYPLIKPALVKLSKIQNIVLQESKHHHLNASQTLFYLLGHFFGQFEACLGTLWSDVCLFGSYFSSKNPVLGSHRALIAFES